MYVYQATIKIAREEYEWVKRSTRAVFADSDQIAIYLFTHSATRWNTLVISSHISLGFTRNHHLLRLACRRSSTMLSHNSISANAPILIVVVVVISMIWICPDLLEDDVSLLDVSWRLVIFAKDLLASWEALSFEASSSLTASSSWCC